MVAFWEENPNAPSFPTPNNPNNPDNPDNPDKALTWPLEFVQDLSTNPINPDSPHSPVSPENSSSHDKNHHKSINNNPAVLNMNAVWGVQRVLDRIDSPSSPSSPSNPVDITNEEDHTPSEPSVATDLLNDGVFSHFTALNSGLLLAKKGVCSTNCGSDHCEHMLANT